MPMKTSANRTKVAVFDVCGTLYRSNTTHDFVMYLWTLEPFSVRKLILSIINRFKPITYLLVLVGRWVNIDLVKNVNVYSLKYFNAEKIDATAKSFTDDYLAKKENVAVFEILNKCRSENFRLFLASSSIEPVVKQISRHLLLDGYVASTIDIEKGRIVDEIQNIKIEKLDEIFNVNEYDIVVSDNVSDLSLLLKSVKGICVVRRSKDERYWREHPLEILKLYNDQ